MKKAQEETEEQNTYAIGFQIPDQVEEEYEDEEEDW